MSKYSDSILLVEEDYFNLNDIMSTRANIACTYKQGTPSEFFRLIGQPAPASISERGYKTETPAWMICTLTEGAIDYSPQLPIAFNEITRNSLLAGPESKNLENLSLHFYLFGIRLARLFNNKTGKQIAEAIFRIMQKRSGWILRLAVDPTLKPSLLDSTEKRLFFKAQRIEIITLDWYHGKKENEKMSRKRSHAEVS